MYRNKIEVVKEMIFPKHVYKCLWICIYVQAHVLYVCMHFKFLFTSFNTCTVFYMGCCASRFRKVINADKMTMKY